ncbi:MAG: tetratricopeptide repeat protein [Sphingorhabdus sp.]
MLLIGVAALSAAPAQQKAYRPNDDARAAYQSAKTFMAKQDWRSARVELQNSIKDDPDWADARLALADTALHLFDPVSAMEQIEKAQKLGVNARDYNHFLAHAQWMAGQPAKAVETLQNGPLANTHLPYAYRVLGRAQLDLGDSVAAAQTYERALRLTPDDAMLWTEIGRLRMVVSDQAGAIQALERAVALDANNVRALELRGRLVRNQFGLIAALPWFERGLAVDPNDVPLLEHYGATLGESGRYRDMLVQARKILQLDSSNVRAIYMQAVIAARARNFTLARRLLDRVGGGFGEMTAPQLLRAVCEYELGNPNQAVEILGRLNSEKANNETIRLALARALYKSGDQDGAWEAIRPVAGRNDGGTYTQRLAGRILEAQGEREDAATFLDRSGFPNASTGQAALQSGPASVAAEEAARNPDDARAVIPHIRFLLTAGKTAEARIAATRLLKGNEGVADAQIVMGDAEWLSGNVAAAVAAYERARALHFSRSVLTRLTTAYRGMGNGSAASESIAAYVSYNPADVVGLRMFAFDLMDRGQWAPALPLLLKVRVQSGFNDGALNANIARTLSELGRHDEAIRMAKLAYRADPASLMTTRIYGNALAKAKRQIKTARALLRKANKMAPADKAIAMEYALAIRL